jgi:Leucine-rich repeat (LRR) protein
LDVEEQIAMDLDGDGLIGRYPLGSFPSKAPTAQPCWARRDDSSVSPRSPRYVRIRSDDSCLLNSAIPRDAVVLSFNDVAFPVADVSSLPENIFWGLTALQEVDLRFASLTNLPERIFENIVTLRKFSCTTCNSFSEFKKNTFVNSRSTNALEIVLSKDGGTSPTILPEGLFAGLKVNLLSLSDTDITSRIPIASLAEGLLDGVDVGTFYLRDRWYAKSVIPAKFFRRARSIGYVYSTTHFDTLLQFCGKNVNYEYGEGSGASKDSVLLDYTGFACPLDGACWYSLANTKGRIVAAVGYGSWEYDYYTLFGDRTGVYKLIDSSERCATNAQVPRDAKTLFLVDQSRIPPLSDSDSVKRATALPADFFQGLTQLQKLYLNGSSYTSYPENLFQPVISTLEIISMERISLAEVPSGTFRNLNQLKVISMYASSVASLPLFQNLPKLEICVPPVIADKKLPAFSFYNLPLLRKIYLSDRLTSIDPRSFGMLPSLTSLTLMFTKISEFPVSLFAELYSLQYLGLSWGDISKIPNGLFDPLSQLQTLDFSVNDIVSIDPFAFRKLTNLQEL